MKLLGKKSTTIALVVVAIVLLIAVSAVSTVAYLFSKRNATGYLNFATGVSVEYRNVNATSEGFGNLKQFVDSDDNGLIDDGELINLNLSNIQPSDDIVFANPNLLVKDGSVPFALRIKFVVTDSSNLEDVKTYTSREEINTLLSTSATPVFASGTLEVDDVWKYNEADKYYYYSDDTDFANSIKKVEYVETTTSPIYIFKGDSANNDIISCKVIDGEPIESFPVKNLQLELFIEAIQYTSVNLWFE